DALLFKCKSPVDLLRRQDGRLFDQALRSASTERHARPAYRLIVGERRMLNTQLRYMVKSLPGNTWSASSPPYLSPARGKLTFPNACGRCWGSPAAARSSSKSSGATPGCAWCVGALRHASRMDRAFSITRGRVYRSTNCRALRQSGRHFDVRAVDTNVLARYYLQDDARQARISRALMESGDLFVPKTVILELEWVLRAAA